MPLYTLISPFSFWFCWLFSCHSSLSQLPLSALYIHFISSSLAFLFSSSAAPSFSGSAFGWPMLFLFLFCSLSDAASLDQI